MFSGCPNGHLYIIGDVSLLNTSHETHYHHFEIVLFFGISTIWCKTQYFIKMLQLCHSHKKLRIFYPPSTFFFNFPKFLALLLKCLNRRKKKRKVFFLLSENSKMKHISSYENHIMNSHSHYILYQDKQKYR